MYSREERIAYVQEMVGEKFVIFNEETNQILSVSGWNQYGDAKSVFDSPTEVVSAYEELGLHEDEVNRSENIVIASLADSLQF